MAFQNATGSHNSLMTEGAATGVTTPSVLGYAVLRDLRVFGFASATTAVAGSLQVLLQQSSSHFNLH